MRQRKVKSPDLPTFIQLAGGEMGIWLQSQATWVYNSTRHRVTLCPLLSLSLGCSCENEDKTVLFEVVVRTG